MFFFLILINIVQCAPDLLLRSLSSLGSHTPTESGINEKDFFFSSVLLGDSGGCMDSKRQLEQ